MTEPTAMHQPIPLSLATQGIREVAVDAPRRQRLTMAWLDGGEPVLLPQGESSYATVAVTWPTLPDGSMPRQGEPRAALLRLSGPQLHELLATHRKWPLALHDVWARDGQFDPCALCLRVSPTYAELDTHVRALIRLLTSFQSDVPPMSPQLERPLISGL